MATILAGTGAGHGSFGSTPGPRPLLGPLQLLPPALRIPPLSIWSVLILRRLSLCPATSPHPTAGRRKHALDTTMKVWSFFPQGCGLGGRLGVPVRKKRLSEIPRNIKTVQMSPATHHVKFWFRGGSPSCLLLR